MYSLGLLFFILLKSDAHDLSTSSESAKSSSSDGKEEHSYRRMANRQWEYEGIAIDPSHRRIGDSASLERKILVATSEKTTTTTVKPYPPLNPRYRRIFNPDETAAIEEYPFMAAVLMNDKLWCGGAVISDNKILTAAHCLQLQYNNRFFREYVRMLSVRVGSSNATASGDVYPVNEIFFHPNYKPSTLEFNLAVLQLSNNITINKHDVKVQRIEYATDKTMPIDKTVTFLGWGSVLGADGAGGDVLLQKVDMPIYDLADCQTIYGREFVTRNNFCAGYISIAKNVCNHDAGGPAVMDGVLVGILSFSSKRCDEPDKPAVFATAGAARPWLEGIEQVQQTRDAFITSKLQNLE